MQCTVKKTFEIARQTGNDLIVQVKGNQKFLLHSLEVLAATTVPIDIDDSRGLGRNRQEDRLVEVYTPGTALDDEWAPHIAAVVHVTRRTLVRSAASGLWKTREETAIYTNSIKF